MSSGCSSPNCQLANQQSTSELKFDKVAYIWTLDNFDFREAAGDFVRSPIFSPVSNKTKWRMMVSFYKRRISNDENESNDEDDTTDQEFISLFLGLNKLSEQRRIFAQFQVSILNEERNKVFSKSSPQIRQFHLNLASYKHRTWGWSEFCKKDDHFRSQLLSDNKLTILCEITYPQVGGFEIITHHQCPRLQFQQNTSKCDLPENLASMLTSRLFTDVVLSIKGTEFPAHKAILAARCPVFAAMFQHDTRENQLNRVEITDMDADVAAKMLHYIYTGECQNPSGELNEGLLAAADKYNLDRLKLICGETLLATLSVENAATFLLLADMHCANELKAGVIRFIVGKPTEVFDSPGWSDVLSKPHLANELFRAVASRLEKFLI